MYIYTEDIFRPELKYIPFGTIGFIKTTDNEVRQCKCMGAKWTPNENDKDFYTPQYEWKIAGIKEHQFIKSVSRPSMGIIYTTEEYAQRGSASHYASTQKGEMTATATFRIFNYLIDKYKMDTKCFDCKGTFNNLFHIKTYSSNNNHTTTLRPTDFEVFINENGIDCRIPMLEGAVNGFRRYPTAEKAYASMKPLKTYLLDDDDDDDVQPTISKVKVTIEVETTNIENIKKYATILD